MSETGFFSFMSFKAHISLRLLSDWLAFANRRFQQQLGGTSALSLTLCCSSWSLRRSEELDVKQGKHDKYEIRLMVIKVKSCRLQHNILRHQPDIALACSRHGCFSKTTDWGRAFGTWVVVFYIGQILVQVRAWRDDPDDLLCASFHIMRV